MSITGNPYQVAKSLRPVARDRGAPSPTGQFAVEVLCIDGRNGLPQQSGRCIRLRRALLKMI